MHSKNGKTIVFVCLAIFYKIRFVWKRKIIITQNTQKANTICIFKKSIELHSIKCGIYNSFFLFDGHTYTQFNNGKYFINTHTTN